MYLAKRWLSFNLTSAVSLKTEDLVLLDPPGRLQLWNMAAPEDSRFLVASSLLLLKSLTVNLLICILARFLQPC